MPLEEYLVTLRIRTVDGIPADWDWQTLLDMAAGAGESVEVLLCTHSKTVDLENE